MFWNVKYIHIAVLRPGDRVVYPVSVAKCWCFESPPPHPSPTKNKTKKHKTKEPCRISIKNSQIFKTYTQVEYIVSMSFIFLNCSGGVGLRRNVNVLNIHYITLIKFLHGFQISRYYKLDDFYIHIEGSCCACYNVIYSEIQRNPTSSNLIWSIEKWTQNTLRYNLSNANCYIRIKTNACLRYEHVLSSLDNLAMAGARMFKRSNHCTRKFILLVWCTPAGLWEFYITLHFLLPACG